MSDIQPGDEEPYRVTRGKPPREYQFKPGQSGNPKGRPKGSKQLEALIEEELDRKIEITLNGRRTKLAKRRIMARQLVDKALQGDHKAIATCLTSERAKGGGFPAKADGPDVGAEIDTVIAKDEEILRAYLARAVRDGQGTAE